MTLPDPGITRDDAAAPPPERVLLGAFLGEERARMYPDDPAGLLGVDPRADKQGVVGALQQSLAELAAHPFGTSPEAAEVRMVLQQCASRLLDELDVAERLGVPRERASAPSLSVTPPTPPAPPSPRHAASAPGGGSKPPAPSAPEPARSPAPRVDYTPTGLEHDAARILAQAGSVENAIKSLTALAAARGLPPETARRAMANLTVLTSRASAAGSAKGAPSIAPAANGQAHTPPTDRAATPADDPGRHSPEFEDPAQALLRKTIVIGAIVAAVCIAGVIAVIAALSGSGGKGAAAGGGGAPAPTSAAGFSNSVTPQAGSTGPAGISTPSGVPQPDLASLPATGRLAPRTPEVPATSPGTRVEGDAVLQGLRRAAELAATDHGAAMASFRQAVQGARSWWPTHDPSTRVAIAESIVESLYRFAATGAGALPAVDALAPTSTSGAPMTADDVWPTSWSAGVLLRLSREREWPGSVVVRVQSLLTDALGPERPPGSTSFADGAALSLVAMPARLLARYAPAAGPGVSAPPDAEAQLPRAFSLWTQAVQAARAGAPPETAEGAAMDGLTLLLVHTPDSTSSRAVFRAIESAVSLERWRKDGQARPRLLAWFDDPRVTTANLSLVTQTLVQRSSAEGVDLSMVLSPGAGDSQRSELRDAFAKAWNLEGLQPAAWLTEGLRQSLDEALRSTEGSGAPLADLRATVLLARATQAASGRTGAMTEAQVQITLQDLMSLPRQSAPLDIRNWEWSTAQPRAWGLDFLTGDRTLAYRVQRMGMLSNDFQLSIMEAEVLADVCLSGTQPELRAAARNAAIRCQDQWSVIYGLLQALPRMGRTDTNMRFIGQVTQRALVPASSPAWAHDARRACVERLLELLLNTSEDHNADRLAAQLAEAVSGMTGKPTPAEQINDDDAGQAALTAGRKLFEAARTEAGKHVPNERAPVRLDQIDRRRASRVSAAVGPIQQFAAEQVSATEALAYAVSGEQPADAPQVRAIIEAMQRDRRAAAHVFAQMKATQRAQVRLWLLRLDRGGRGTSHAVGAPAAPGAAPLPAPPGSRPVHAPDSARPAVQADYTNIRVPRLLERLGALSPADPLGYFLLAEEVAAEARDRAGRDLARRLYLLAFVLDQPGTTTPGGSPRRGELGPSVCLGLAALTTREGERRWLAATAAVVESELAGMVGGGGHQPPPPRQTLIVDDLTGLQLATLIGAVRSGNGRLAQSLLKKPGVSRALDAYAGVLEDRGSFGMAGYIRMQAENYLHCPDCKNKRVVVRIERPGEPARPMVCPTCRGVPGPVMTQADLLSQLAMESALLRGIHRLWSSQALSDGGEPLRDPSPDELPMWYGFDPARSVFRDGQWAEPPPAPPSPKG